MASIGPVVSEEMFENVDDGQWTPEAYLYYKLTNEPKGSGELNIQTAVKYSLILKRRYTFIQSNRIFNLQPKAIMDPISCIPLFE